MLSNNDKNSYINNLEKGDLLFIWLGCDSDDLSNLNDSLSGVFEEGYYALITNKDLKLEDNDFLETLIKLYSME